jgi:hypothetical protein
MIVFARSTTFRGHVIRATSTLLLVAAYVLAAVDGSRQSHPRRVSGQRRTLGLAQVRAQAPAADRGVPPAASSARCSRRSSSSHLIMSGSTCSTLARIAGARGQRDTGTAVPASPSSRSGIAGTSPGVGSSVRQC